MRSGKFRKAIALAALLAAGNQAHAVDIGVFQGGALLGTIDPFSGPTTGVANYNYFSASAHPLVGPTPTPGEAFFWFFDGTDGLSFNFFGGQDNSGSCDMIGPPTLCEMIDLDIAINGSTTNPAVLLSDDSSELSEPAADMFRMRGNFANNTDGGVIGLLGGLDWEVVVDPLQWTSSLSGDPVLGTFNVSAVGPSGSVALNNGTGDPDFQIIFRPLRVPEPATFGLLALMLPLIAWRRRRI